MTEATSSLHLDLPALDTLTGGAFTAPTSGERATRIREWLLTEPPADQLQAVFRELSGRDKGAAKPVRERLDELKRARHQEAAAAEWAHKAEHLLQLPRLNLADALAWQRDAAKAGAPLGREPLAGLKTQLAERVKGIEDLQNRVQVQREAAVLLAQRLEVLTTKAWRDAQAAVPVLQADIAHWREQADALGQDANWVSVDARFPPLLDASRAQLQGVWDAFSAALAQAAAAAADAAAPLPPVPVWADELRGERGLSPFASAPAQADADPQARTRANDAVETALQTLEREVKDGHVKASAGAAAALRAALKEHARLIEHALEQRAQAALATAGELEGWQRWRADQLREELVRKAEALLGPPPVVPAKLKGVRPERNKAPAQGGAVARASDTPATPAASADQPDAQTRPEPTEATEATGAADPTAAHGQLNAADPALTGLAAEPFDAAEPAQPEPSDVVTPPSSDADAAAQIDELMVADATSDDSSDGPTEGAEADADHTAIERPEWDTEASSTAPVGGAVALETVAAPEAASRPCPSPNRRVLLPPQRPMNPANRA